MASSVQTKTKRSTDSKSGKSNVVKFLPSMRKFFKSGTTLEYQFRRDQLQKLKKTIQIHERELTQALHLDLRKSSFETYITEIGFVYAEIDYALKNLKSWMRPKQVVTPMILFPSASRIVAEPVGTVLIFAAWNYPVQVSLAPLVAAIASGNCAVLKPSEIASHTAETLAKILGDNFDEQYIKVVNGGVDVSTELLKEKFDHIIFTGSTAVGKIIARAAAEHLTPATLELGGKSPVIVDETADIKTAAKRIAWGKFVNAGQTCLAPDYVLVKKEIKDELLIALKKQIEEFYGDDARTSPDYARIVNRINFFRLKKMLQAGTIITGGATDEDDLYIAPTVIDDVDYNDPVMQEEIFGPILPVLTYTDLDEVFELVDNQPTPLSLYAFTNDPEVENQLIKRIPFGGGCINNTLIHAGNPRLPFGGVGTSGMGSYHGKHGFDRLSHKKSIIKTPKPVDLPIKYPPYRNHINYLKWFMK